MVRPRFVWGPGDTSFLPAVPDALLRVATARPVHVWGAPGIGKSIMVKAFAAAVGMDCGTQLAPEDLIGVPQIVTGGSGAARSRFAPPAMSLRARLVVRSCCSRRWSRAARARPGAAKATSRATAGRR